MNESNSGLIGGVFDIGVGVNDLDEALEFWQSCGYRRGPQGSLTAAESLALYGVASELTSHRLLHQDATAGLIRLMKWKQPTGPGLQMAPLRTHGCRWSVHKTDDIANAYVHGEVLRRQGKPIHLVGPHYNLDLGKKLADKKPFHEMLAASGDVLLFQPEAQLVAMTRLNFSVPKYGTINKESPLRLSEGCHMALVVQAEDIGVFDFYEDVIGFKRYQQVDIVYEPGYMPSDMFHLTPEETFSEVDFDDPEAGNDPKEHLPGRLRCFIVHSKQPADDRMDRAQPGNLGHSMYSVRVGNIVTMHASVAGSDATRVTDIRADEFGTPAFSFVAPDGFTWTVMAYEKSLGATE